MKKQLLFLPILIIALLIIPTFFIQTFAASNEPYEMQKVVELDKKLDVVYNTKKGINNRGSEQLLERTTSDYGYNDLVIQPDLTAGVYVLRLGGHSQRIVRF